jgi:7-carboxy-7-deazaguanine synthase
MKISEIFYSIEGEGLEIGKPEVFIRPAECNLRCQWCDTKYAFENTSEKSIQEILLEIEQYPCKNVSITGGEPLLQQQEIKTLIHKLKKLGYWIQINTNGTMFNQEIFELVDRISMDCKCPSSKETSKTDVLHQTKNMFNQKTQFKFILSNMQDYLYAKETIQLIFDDAENIIFQPEWSRRTYTKCLIDLVKNDQLNVRIIVQQHKMIWRTKRKV